MTKTTLTDYVKELEGILNKDYNHEIPDISRSREFTKVYRKMLTSMIKEKGWRLSVLTPPTWSFMRGFIINEDNKRVYFCTPDYRYFNYQWQNSVLVRTATNDKDFNGGVNHYTPLENFVANVECLFNE